MTVTVGEALAMHNPLAEESAPRELYVVGEHRENPNYLLTQGPDGQYYAYELPDGEPEAVEVNDLWKLESSVPDDYLT